MTKRLVALLFALGFVLVTRAAKAEACRPPAPGTWSDERVEGLYDSGQERLRSARGFEGDARSAAARQAEAMFREIETRIACLPTNVVALAESLTLQQKYLEGIAQYRRLLDERATLEKHRFWREALAAAEAGESSARRQIGTAVLKLDKRACAKGALIARFDGRPVTLDEPLSVDPGDHAVRVEGAGCTPFVQNVFVNPGQSVVVSVALEAPVPPKPKRDERDETKWLGLPPWVVIAGSAAIVATGVVLTAVALSDPNEKPPSKPSCPGQDTICVYLQ